MSSVYLYFNHAHSPANQTAIYTNTNINEIINDYQKKKEIANGSRFVKTRPLLITINTNLHELTSAISLRQTPRSQLFFFAFENLVITGRKHQDKKSNEERKYSKYAA